MPGPAKDPAPDLNCLLCVGPRPRCCPLSVLPLQPAGAHVPWSSYPSGSGAFPALAGAQHPDRVPQGAQGKARPQHWGPSKALRTQMATRTARWDPDPIWAARL